MIHHPRKVYPRIKKNISLNVYVKDLNTPGSLRSFIKTNYVSSSEDWKHYTHHEKRSSILVRIWNRIYMCHLWSSPSRERCSFRSKLRYCIDWILFYSLGCVLCRSYFVYFMWCEWQIYSQEVKVVINLKVNRMNSILSRTFYVVTT